MTGPTSSCSGSSISLVASNRVCGSGGHRNFSPPSVAFAVGLLHVLNAYKGVYVSAERLGADACHVEIELCGEPIGKQDQYAAAFGGFNLIEFNPDESVVVSPIICARETLATMEQETLVFYTGITRSTSALLKQQSGKVKKSTSTQETLMTMVRLAYQLRDELQRNNAWAMGEILHENWVLKKTLVDGISDSEIDDWYETARSAGALGGKLLGAGKGGFMMFFAPPERHAAIVHALPGLREVRFRFDSNGSQIIFYRP